MYRSANFITSGADAAAAYVRYIVTPSRDFHSLEKWGLPEEPMPIHDAWQVQAIDMGFVRVPATGEEHQGHLWAIEVAFTPYLRQGFIRVAQGVVGWGQHAHVVLPDGFGPVWAVSALFYEGSVFTNTNVELKIGYKPWTGAIHV